MAIGSRGTSAASSILHCSPSRLTTSCCCPRSRLLLRWAAPTGASMHTDDRYLRAAFAGGVAVWHWNLLTGELYADPVLKESLGFEDHEVRDRAEDWLNLVHPDDAAFVRQRIEAHLRGETPLYESEYRLAHRDGTVRW